MTSWRHSRGGQREIALWNVGMLATLLAAHRNQAGRPTVWQGLAVLSTALGINHLAAAAEEPKALGHWLGVGANLAGALIAMRAPAGTPVAAKQSNT